ncbi:MAG: hypothetical protein EAZ70_10230 [Runella slithyformis]|jgi:hypothetical protein|nr:MAG: hypothetical protein EAY79_10975 [Runella slithyformis]TAF01554.1 MAG: hypothetical protein EAZ80_02590 [Runella slithyformis]TAF25452.1 MAG: hypothetical protein EAZ70_10230 [Runella slithyformis]TAF43718.1 MAG: hypothetical protein EAZ63_13345 [Runella slithyformis]TAF79839.1 MAG: hypothetical protein EAZ50_10330 [Runella slithyformis]
MAKKKEWKEGEMISVFGLTKIVGNQTPLMQEWTNIGPPKLSIFEQYNFDNAYQTGVQKIDTWSEEDLKMNSVG